MLRGASSLACNGGAKSSRQQGGVMMILRSSSRHPQTTTSKLVRTLQHGGNSSQSRTFILEKPLPICQHGGVLANTCAPSVTVARRSFAKIPSSPAGSMYTAPKKDGFQIPAQGLVFTILLVPVMALTVYAGQFGPTEESLEEEVGERYSGRLAENKQKRSSHMAEFFQEAIHKPKEGNKVDDDLHKLLIAGKGGKKRMHAVNKDYYGTAEGVAEKKRQEENIKAQKELKRKKKAAGEISNVVAAKEDSSSKASSDGEQNNTKKVAAAETKDQNAATTPPSSSSASASRPVDGKSVALVAAVATVAATAGFLVGGGNRR